MFGKLLSTDTLLNSFEHTDVTDTNKGKWKRMINVMVSYLMEPLWKNEKRKLSALKPFSGMEESNLPLHDACLISSSIPVFLLLQFCCLSSLASYKVSNKAGSQRPDSGGLITALFSATGLQDKYRFKGPSCVTWSAQSRPLSWENPHPHMLKNVNTSE